MFMNSHVPPSLEDCVFSSDEIRQRIQDYAGGRRQRHILLYGPFGTGKSTVAKLLAESFVPRSTIPHLDTEIVSNAADFDKDIFDEMRKRWLNYIPHYYSARRPCTVIDEADLMPIAVQRRLTAFLERWGDEGILILTTNYEHQLDGALLHRLDKIEFPVLSAGLVDCV